MTHAIVDALIDYHAKQGRTIRITEIKQGKGTIAGCVLIPGPLEIEFDVIAGDEPPSERGMIIFDPGEPVRIEPQSRKDPWEELIAQEEAERREKGQPTPAMPRARNPNLKQRLSSEKQPGAGTEMGLEIPAFVKRL